MSKSHKKRHHKPASAAYSKAPMQPAKKKSYWWAYLLGFVIVLACVGIAISFMARAEITSPDTETNFEETLFDIAEDYSINPDYYVDPSFSLKSITIDTEYYGYPAYMVKINNLDFDQLFQSGDFVGNGNKYLGLYEETEFAEFNNHQLRLIESARAYVIEYIKDSNVLRDKEALIEGIQNVPFYLFTDTTNSDLLEVIDAPAVHVGSAIFCNEAYEEFYSEYMLVHELVHHLRYLAHGKDFSNMMYIGDVYDEALTDIIVKSTGLDCPVIQGYVCGYERYHSIIGEYLNVFGEKALEGFFYGTDEFINQFYDSFETEHHAFVCALEHYEEHDNPRIVCKAILKYWSDTLA